MRRLDVDDCHNNPYSESVKRSGVVLATADIMYRVQAAIGVQTCNYSRNLGDLTPDFLTLSRCATHSSRPARTIPYGLETSGVIRIVMQFFSRMAIPT